MSGNEEACITINTQRFIVSLDNAEKKAHTYSYSGYIVAAFGLLVHLVVFLMCLLGGAPLAADIYVASFASEAVAALALSARDCTGSMVLLSVAMMWCGTFALVELGLAVSASATNWVHFEAPAFRWVATAFTYVHAILLLELMRCLANTRHAKMQLCYRANQFETSKRSLRGPLLDADAAKKGS